ncbi:hypothetical protein B0H14DRAFT_3746103 [Mycena olivaceomarginata]|nr:hypothetical protein B0H14DRAFT_3746103 [Mycena olivaceomarginata]
MVSEPAFPVELEREIFETTALMHPTAIPGLLRLARRVLIWIEPFLYRVVWAGRHAGIIEAIKAKPPSFFHNAVRHLFLDGSDEWSMEEARQLLKLCKGAVTFAVVGRFSNPTLLPILAEMQIQRMSVVLAPLFGGRQFIDLRNQSFASITHLAIFDLSETVETKISPLIPTLPALTHFSLYSDLETPVIQKLLVECPRLQVLLILWPYSYKVAAAKWAKNSPVRDARFVVALFTEYWDDWENGARGRPHMWSEADSFYDKLVRAAMEGLRITD